MILSLVVALTLQDSGATMFIGETGKLLRTYVDSHQLPDDTRFEDQATKLVVAIRSSQPLPLKSVLSALQLEQKSDPNLVRVIPGSSQENRKERIAWYTSELNRALEGVRQKGARAWERPAADFQAMIRSTPEIVERSITEWLHDAGVQLLSTQPFRKSGEQNATTFFANITESRMPWPEAVSRDLAKFQAQLGEVGANQVLDVAPGRVFPVLAKIRSLPNSEAVSMRIVNDTGARTRTTDLQLQYKRPPIPEIPKVDRENLGKNRVRWSRASLLKGRAASNKLNRVTPEAEETLSSLRNAIVTQDPLQSFAEDLIGSFSPDQYSSIIIVLDDRWLRELNRLTGRQDLSFLSIMEHLNGATGVHLLVENGNLIVRPLWLDEARTAFANRKSVNGHINRALSGRDNVGDYVRDIAALYDPSGAYLFTVIRDWCRSLSDLMEEEPPFDLCRFVASTPGILNHREIFRIAPNLTSGGDLRSILDGWATFANDSRTAAWEPMLLDPSRFEKEVGLQWQRTESNVIGFVDEDGKTRLRSAYTPFEFGASLVSVIGKHAFDDTIDAQLIFLGTSESTSLTATLAGSPIKVQFGAFRRFEKEPRPVRECPAAVSVAVKKGYRSAGGSSDHLGRTEVIHLH